jgi:F0F1-type ATP synthase assembly protein I
MANVAETTVADLESKLAEASAKLQTVKQTASIIGGVALGAGFLWLLWSMFKKEPNGS